ncbi:MAG: Gfo/Idh/MocA family oxidoreductase, partial [Dehalococcoidia bacterium]|nr:Gfo/Idh/MocA family oxidoreductase [Dehalococcoidia bacterium]
MKNQETGIEPGTPIRELLCAGKPWEQTSDRQVRIGVAGGGFGAHFHWHQHPNARVVAVAERRPDRLANLVETYGCTRTYEDLEGLLTDDEVEAVAIFSPAPDHARHCAAAMEAGKHVFCAVPACMTLEEAEMLVEVKERTGCKYMMAETSYYRWETILARFMVQAGSFGELVYTEGEYYHRLTIGEERDVLWFYEGKPTWRYGLPPMHYPTHSTAFL